MENFRKVVTHASAEMDAMPPFAASIKASIATAPFAYLVLAQAAR